MEQDSVVIVAGRRTPFARAGTALAHHSALSLGSHAVTAVMEAGGLPRESIGALCFGNVVLDPRTPNAGREIVLRTDLPPSLPAHTLSAYCISGLRAVTAITQEIASGRIQAGLAAGADSLSQPPLLFRPAATRTFMELARARGLGSRLRALLGFRPGHLLPEAPGVAEPSTGLTMGEHCEITAKSWKIPRAAQDELALRSHRRAVAAWNDGRLAAEVAPLDGLTRDNLLRPDTSLEKLAGLQPVFDKGPAGTLTAGNSSPLTDGGSAVLLASQRLAEEAGAPILARVRDWEYAAIDPADGLLMAPALAVPRLLARHGLTLDDMDLVEVHEAFSAQVLANLSAWEQGWKEQAVGRVDNLQLNVSGSSIAVGHPFAATGGRIITTLANEMHRRQVRRGLVSICAAGAMAGAVLLERP
ncbi:MAG: acetyl-CoA C-acyltransferase [Acidobacteria bacterium]|nr:acetyl-CoA C-acyltransferase [Acidobacteriota bacterium]